MKTAFEKLTATVHALRGENGCPWDKKQTHESLRRHLLEETHEVLEAIDNLSNNPAGYAPLKEELGDLLFQVMLHSELASEKKAFNAEDVANELREKLIRRHPHVFGDQKLADANAVVENWEKLKTKEKKKDSILDGIPPALPALQKSEKIIEKVTRVGFQWDNLQGPVEKLEEELLELKVELRKVGEFAELKANNAKVLTPEQRKAITSELGDLLFCVSNIAYFFEINPEDALREMLGRFEKRFRFVEKKVKADGKILGEVPLAELDGHWVEAKKHD